MKDRLLHPQSFLTKMLLNWQTPCLQSRLTDQLLSYVEKMNLEDVHRFHYDNSHLDDTLGSAFYSVLCFAEEFVERYANSPTAIEMLSLLELGRSETAKPNLVRLKPKNESNSIAFLISLHPERKITLPLSEGRNFVGRSAYESIPKPIFLEPMQWFIECEGLDASICDAASTNLSTLVPQRALLEHKYDYYADGPLPPGLVQIPHPNEKAEKYKFKLSEGDLLENCYGSFLFGWR